MKSSQAINTTGLPAALAEYIRNACSDFSKLIDEDRRGLLDHAAAIVLGFMSTRQGVDLVFVCTHNSRRSQFCQIWSQIGKHVFGLKRLAFHSCGTSTTSIAPQAVAALQRAGVPIEPLDTGNNPIYRITIPEIDFSGEYFSKEFGHPSLPPGGFVAWMCCSDADSNCPILPNLLARLQISFVDPKTQDGTPTEQKTYDDTCQKIATEILYFLWRISQYKAK